MRIQGTLNLSDEEEAGRPSPITGLTCVHEGRQKADILFQT